MRIAFVLNPFVHARLLAALALGASVTGAAFAAAPAAPPAATAPVKANPSPAKPGAIDVRNAYARPTPPESAVGAAYLEIRAKAEDRLVGASSPIAKRAEMHATTESGGMMRMRRVASVPVKAGEAVAFAPGGLHLMLYGLTTQLVPGAKFVLELQFEKAGVVKTEVVVKADDAGAHEH